MDEVQVYGSMGIYKVDPFPWLLLMMKREVTPQDAEQEQQLDEV